MSGLALCSVVTERQKVLRELGVGLFLFILGYMLRAWVSQLLWIQVYPPPAAKQLLDVTQYALWVVGGALILSSIRRYLSKR